jgi:hypothetical protein
MRYAYPAAWRSSRGYGEAEVEVTVASNSRLVRHKDIEAVEGIPEIAFIVLASDPFFFFYRLV